MAHLRVVIRGLRIALGENKTKSCIELVRRIGYIYKPQRNPDPPPSPSPSSDLQTAVEAATKDWRALTEQQQETISKLLSNLRVTQQALKAFFITLGEHEFRG